jgi:hypothetical protein
MAGPVKVKVSGDVEQGLQVLTAAELYQYTGQLILEKFASVNTGTSSVNVTTGSVPANHASIGTFTDRKRNDAVGTHPTSAASTTVNTYTMYQNETTNSATITTPVTLNADGDVLEMTAAEINTEICDAVITSYVEQQATSAGQYYLSASAPSGGTWTNRGTISDTQVDGTTVTKTLWQKTAATTDTTRVSGTGFVKKLDDNSLQEMTDAEIELLFARVANRIKDNDIGKFVLASAAPGTGTWQQMGEIMTDQMKDTATYAYAGSYTGTYSGSYVGAYAGAYAGSYIGAYRLYFSGFSGAAYVGTYTGYYTGYYSGSYTGSYSGTYAGTYNGLTIISSSSTQESKRLWMRTA